MATRKNENFDNYIKELVQEWHYIKSDAEKCSPATFSWMAIPLMTLPTDPGQEPEVQGVVFADSKEKDYFTDERQEIALVVCESISRFVTKRYHKSA